MSKKQKRSASRLLAYLISFAMILARVVLPVPEGPKKMAESRLPLLIA